MQYSESFSEGSPLVWMPVVGACVALIVFMIFYKLNRGEGKNKMQLPPGPSPWAFVMSLYKYGSKPHGLFMRFAKAYGPLMSVPLGINTLVVVSSSAIAKQILNDNGQTFGNRPRLHAARLLGYDASSLAWAPYGPHWRLLRKICNSELFSAGRLEALQHIRTAQISKTIKSVFEDCRGGKPVNIATQSFLTSFSIVGNMICSKDVFRRGSVQASEFKDMVTEALNLVSVPNVVDFLPFLEFLDIQGLERKMTKLAKRFDAVFNKIIDDRLASMAKITTSNGTADNDNDFLQVLLNLRSEGEGDGSQLSMTDIKALLLDMFVAGTDTISVTIEWTMAELIRNPEVMQKAQEELKEAVGLDDTVKESHLENGNLPYLHAIIKEALRLHPPLPLMAPRMAGASCEIAGRLIPKDAVVIVNVWGMARDDTIWERPSEFIPERFLESDIDYKGRNFSFIPFGAGRRICAGLSLAHRVVHLTVASLIHSFDWCLPGGKSPNEIDMTDKFGSSLQKAVPLIALAKTPRLPLHLY